MPLFIYPRDAENARIPAIAFGDCDEPGARGEWLGRAVGAHSEGLVRPRARGAAEGRTRFIAMLHGSPQTMRASFARRRHFAIGPEHVTALGLANCVKNLATHVSRFDRHQLREE